MINSRDEFMAIAEMRFSLQNFRMKCAKEPGSRWCEKAEELEAEIAWRESEERQSHRILIASNHQGSYLLQGIKGARWEIV